MQFARLLEEDGAVSPVIGVILMVAITVILAAVIGTFVLGMTDALGETPPQTTFGFTYEDGASGTCDLSAGGAGGVGALTVSHEGGDAVDAAAVELVTGADRADWTNCSAAAGTLRAGDTAAVDVEPDQSLRVVWYGERESAVLGRWRGADA